MHFSKSTISLLFFIYSLQSCDAFHRPSSLQCAGFISSSKNDALKQSSISKYMKIPSSINPSQQRQVNNQLNFTPNPISDENLAKSQTQLNAASIPILDNWTITKNGEAIGRVSNHPSPNILDGEMVTTSKLRNVTKINAREGSTVTTASGSKYKLGKPKNAGANFFGSGSNQLLNNGAAAAEAARNKKAAPAVKSKPSWGFNSGNKSAKATSSNASAELEIPLVEDWFISFGGELIGIITGHPNKNIIDGDTVTTSKLRDRNNLKAGDVVVTVNGSKYALGKKKKGLPTTLFQNASNAFSVSTGSNNLSRTFGLLNKQISEAVSNISSASKASSSKDAPVVSQTKLEKDRLRLLKQRYGINGKTLANGKYLLCERAKRSTSGKSNIWSAYKADENGIPVGDKLTIKVSTNFESMTREDNNYNRVCSGLFPGRFVEKAEFLEVCDGFPMKEFETSCALVIENGRKDLRAILNERGGRGFEGRAMRDAASAALQCIQAMHSSGIVWTDLKTENFVIVSDEIGDNGMLPGVKGIDLESAIPRGKNPVDFSPEACPPEFAAAFVSGQGLNFKLDYSYDIWSYGMMLYELTTGKPYFDNKSPAQITMALQYEFEPDLSSVRDDNLRDLIYLCLKYDPKKRPGVTQLLLHPYFLTTGIGPFGF